MSKSIPMIMVLDREPDCQDDVIHIDYDENTMVLQALEDVTISLCGAEFPSGTLRFKAGQVLLFPLQEV